MRAGLSVNQSAKAVHDSDRKRDTLAQCLDNGSSGERGGVGEYDAQFRWPGSMIPDHCRVQGSILIEKADADANRGRDQGRMLILNVQVVNGAEHGVAARVRLQVTDDVNGSNARPIKLSPENCRVELVGAGTPGKVDAANIGTLALPPADQVASRQVERGPEIMDDIADYGADERAGCRG